MKKLEVTFMLKGAMLLGTNFLESGWAGPVERELVSEIVSSYAFDVDVTGCPFIHAGIVKCGPQLCRSLGKIEFEIDKLRLRQSFHRSRWRKAGATPS